MNDAAPVALLARPGGRPAGEHGVPGDKSISHRALLLGALAEGDTGISGLLEGEDCLATARAVEALGVTVERQAAGEWRVRSPGHRAWRTPARDLDCGNAGTAARLLMGALAAGPGRVRITGDASLSRRPMRRVTEPLTRMGVRIDLSPGGGLPATVHGTAGLSDLQVALPVASAQVKSALLLAGVVSGRAVELSTPVATRDHSERLLRAFGVRVSGLGARVRLAAGARPVATQVRVPGDLSSAAFLLAAAAAVPGARLTVTGVGLNPTRTGVLDLLQRFGAEVWSVVDDVWAGEPVGRVTVEGRALRGFRIPEALVAPSIDELPLILALAGLAEGVTELRGAAELRVKESDRLANMARGLTALGVRVKAHPDGLRVQGGGLSGGTVDAAGDHRVAMAFAVAAVAARGPIRIEGSALIGTSFPGFLPQARAAGLDLAAAA